MRGPRGRSASAATGSPPPAIDSSTPPPDQGHQDGCEHRVVVKFFHAEVDEEPQPGLPLQHLHGDYHQNAVPPQSAAAATWGSAANTTAFQKIWLRVAPIALSESTNTRSALRAP